MARVRLALDRTGLRKDATDASRPVVNRTTRRLFNVSQVLCPVGETGILRGSGSPKYNLMSARGPRGLVEYRAKYAAAVNDGQGPRIIRARLKKALAFEIGGRTIVRKSVSQKARPPQPFLTRAAEQVTSEGGYRYIRKGPS